MGPALHDDAVTKERRIYPAVGGLSRATVDEFRASATRADARRRRARAPRAAMTTKSAPNPSAPLCFQPRSYEHPLPGGEHTDFGHSICVACVRHDGAHAV